MKLGNDRVGLRKRQVTGRDARGNDVFTNVDSVLRWCSITPLTSTEADDESTPRVTGMRLLAPPGADIEAADAIVWPITSEATVGGQLQLTGRTWEVIGDVGLWPAAVDVALRRS